VLCITGNGLKTPDATSSTLDFGALIEPRLSAFAQIAQTEDALVTV
jgi:hypothetical protein